LSNLGSQSEAPTSGGSSQQSDKIFNTGHQACVQTVFGERARMDDQKRDDDEWTTVLFERWRDTFEYGLEFGPNNVVEKSCVPGLHDANRIFLRESEENRTNVSHQTLDVQGVHTNLHDKY
jgi:hypothetical protein